MRVEFINPFVAAAFNVLERVGKSQAKKGKLSKTNSPVRGNEVNVVIGVTGSVIGQVICSMSMETARKISSLMLFGMPVTDLDDLAKSALSELGNMITGNAATELGNSGYLCNLTTASIFIGREITVSIQDVQILQIPVSTDMGELIIFVALKESEE
jgi:chemotaxis protein CheX